MRDDEDDENVSVGDDSPFATSTHAQPWVRSSGLTPWHMWGNSQTILGLPATAEEPPNPATPQLIKVAYRRPDTWRWLLSARVLRALRPSEHGAPATFDELTVLFDLTIGHGRSQVQMPAFERFHWTWGDGTDLPTFHPMWSTQARTPPLDFSFSAGPPTAVIASDIRPLTEIVGEDIQCSARVFYEVAGFSGPRPTIDVEVYAFFAPNTHVRPDWYQLDTPIEAQFSGEEIRGR